MKWNWGTKLALAMAAFMIMVIIFGILMMRESVNLVEKDYYPKGQAYQEQILKKKNAEAIQDEIQLELKNGLLLLKFPDTLDIAKVKGTVHLYHRENELKDLMADLMADKDRSFKVDVGNLAGRYIVKIDWTYNNTPYYLEKSVDIK